MVDRLKINQKIDLEVKSGPYQGKYLSKVAEVEGELIKVSAPFVKGELVPLRKNQPLTIFFTGNNAAYKFNAVVVSRVSKPVALLILKKAGSINRIQRREYFRIDAGIDVKYRLLDHDGEPVGDIREVTTIDISGGGLKLIVDENLSKGTLIGMFVDLPNIDDTMITGRVINNYNLTDITAIGVEFVEIDHYTRENIISWLFDYQRELRKKGLL